jgi:hypothetical protein
MPRHSGSIGTVLRQVHRVKILPLMLTPITLAELTLFYDALVDELVGHWVRYLPSPAPTAYG